MVQNELNLLEDDSGLNDIYNAVNELQNCANRLKENSSDVKDRFRSYDWRVWKWPGITINIIKKIGSMMSTAVNLASSVNKLKTNVDNFKTAECDSIDDPSFDKDAKSMAQKLSKTMSTTFTAKKVNATEIKKGDIVQYISQGKYPRYLEVVNIINPHNTTGNDSGRQLLDHSYNVPIFVLKGLGDKEIKTFNNDYMELIPNKPVRPENVLQNSVQIQQKDIKKTRNNAQNAEKTVEEIDTDYLTYLMGGILLGASGVVCVGVGLLSTPIPPLSAPIFILGGILTGTGFVCGMIGLGLYTIKEDYVKKANKLKNNAKLCEDDLKSYTNIEEKETLSMNVTTFNGIPIIKKPPISNWKELQFIPLENPQHGDLLHGSGLQFLYSPNEGYTGNDTFRFQYTDKYDKIKGYMTVNIQIKPIPVFTLENNETTTQPDINNQNNIYNQINKAQTNILTVFDEATHTELTKEQKQYLETHEHRILTKAETILNNLHKEYYEKTNSDNENPTQRKLLQNKEDKFTKDANKIVNYLNTNGFPDTTTVKCNITELKNLTQNKSYEDKIIVQIKDHEYIRYMKLITINNDTIHLISGKEKIKKDYDLFINQYIWKNDGEHNNPDRRFNIILNPTGYDSDYILDEIYGKQYGILKDSMDNCDLGLALCAPLFVVGVTIITAGSYRLCDSCIYRTSQIIIENSRIADNEEEFNRLIEPNKLIKTYRTVEEVSNNRYCNKHSVAVSTIICGLFIALGSLAGIISCIKIKQKNIDIKTNLEKYNPDN